jgi:hypothetical protein
MARVELADYPTNSWSDGSEVSLLAEAETYFERALRLNNKNRTAWHRLGLIAIAGSRFR